METDKEGDIEDGEVEVGVEVEVAVLKEKQTLNIHATNLQAQKGYLHHWKKEKVRYDYTCNFVLTLINYIDV